MKREERIVFIIFIGKCHALCLYSISKKGFLQSLFFIIIFFFFDIFNETKWRNKMSYTL